MKLFETVTKHFAWYTDVLMSCILMKWPFDCILRRVKVILASRRSDAKESVRVTESVSSSLTLSPSRRYEYGSIMVSKSLGPSRDRVSMKVPSSM